MKRNRALLALLPVAMVAGLLTSCSASPTSAIEGIDCAPEGDVSKSIEVEGKFGEAGMKLKTKTPIKATKLETSTLIKGDGDQVKENDALAAMLTIFDGETGEAVSSEASVLELNAEKLLPWALEIVACSSIGDRVAAAAPVSEVLGDQAANYGLEATGSLVIVFDMISVEEQVAEPGSLEPADLLEKAEGKAQTLPAGLPTVVLAEDGSPTITMPEGVAAPGTLTVETLIKGDGEEVKEGDRVYVHYRGVIWRTGEEFDSSWSRGSRPRSRPLA